jgi:N-methylhydantoinase A
MTHEKHQRIRVGVDTGGTFTDVVAFDEGSGELVTTKTPSTPANPADGVLAGVRKVLQLMGASGSDVSALCHGTTVATNALLEGTVGRVGLVTTQGYEFILEIARQSVPDGYGNSYFWVKPPRIVPADLVRTVGGRMDAQGAEIRPFDEADAVAAARFLRARGVTAVGICFLHSYANDAHELAMREVLRREHPDAVVSISSEVLREYREYERSMTTLVDAAVKPTVSRYVADIAERLDGMWSSRPGAFFVMTSGGGVLSAAEVVNQPITTVLSGPAAGALGAAMVARRAGIERVLTCDGGGTSTDVSVVLGGEPALTTQGWVGAYPSRIPMVDVVTVGAGGGSVAWVSPEGTLKVGPRSAGAVPGPMCYPGGGDDPTVTDAHLVLGRIPPHLLGGEILLDPEAARRGITDLGARLGLDPVRCAHGILEISAWNQANALRQVSVRRGLDVRDFVLTTFGGSGSLLACRLVDLLDLAGALVPRDPGNLSAFGLLTVDVRGEVVQTRVCRHADLDLGDVGAVIDRLTDRAGAALGAQGFAPSARRFARSADLRYVGQAYEVRVPAGAGPVDANWADAVAARFHDEHRRLYGYDFRGDPRQEVEWVNLRVAGTGPITRPDLRPLPRREADPPDHPATTPMPPGQQAERAVCFDPDAGAIATAIRWRPGLRPGDTVAGPAVIEEFGATVPVHPGFVARVDDLGNLHLDRETSR